MPVMVSRPDGSRAVSVAIDNWRRILHLAQWGGWRAPLDHWDFRLDEPGARAFADALAKAVEELGELPRSGPEVALRALGPLGLSEQDALEGDALVGLALFEIRSRLRDFFVQEADALLADCGATISLARDGCIRVAFAA